MKNIIQNSKILLISSISATMAACHATGQNMRKKLAREEIKAIVDAMPHNNLQIFDQAHWIPASYALERKAKIYRGYEKLSTDLFKVTISINNVMTPQDSFQKRACMLGSSFLLFGAAVFILYRHMNDFPCVAEAQKAIDLCYHYHDRSVALADLSDERRGELPQGTVEHIEKMVSETCGILQKKYSRLVSECREPDILDLIPALPLVGLGCAATGGWNIINFASKYFEDYFKTSNHATLSKGKRTIDEAGPNILKTKNIQEIEAIVSSASEALQQMFTAMIEIVKDVVTQKEKGLLVEGYQEKLASESRQLTQILNEISELKNLALDQTQPNLSKLSEIKIECLEKGERAIQHVLNMLQTM